MITDSSSLLPAELADRFGVTVVPITVSLDGRDYLEGIDLDADGFFDLFAAAADEGRTLEVATAQPSPGMFAAAYQALVDDGATEIVSVHVGSAYSGTINSARLGADLVEARVEIVDTGSMSFGISCCVWEAASVVLAGGAIEDAVAAAGAVAARVRTAFILQAMDLLVAGGRVSGQLAVFEKAASASPTAIPVMVAGPGDAFAVAGEGHTVDELSALMADTMHSDGRPIRVGVSVADRATEAFADAIESRLRERDDVVDMIRYRVGPSVAAHTGPGTAGGFWYPLP